MGTKEEILALDDRRTEELVVPEWGGRTIRLRVMSSADRDSWEGEIFRNRASGPGGEFNNARASLVARCAVDEQGERIFQDADIAALGKKSAKALDRLYDACRKLNALSEAEVKEIEKP